MTNPFDDFDNDAPETTDEQYSAFVEWLSETYAARLAECAGDTQAQDAVVHAYLERGEAANLTLPELLDFLGISSNSVLDRAGYGEAEQTAVFDRLADASDPAGAAAVSV